MNFDDDPSNYYSNYYGEDGDSYSGSDDDLLPPEVGGGDSNSGSDFEDGRGEGGEDSFEEPDKYITTFSDLSRVGGGGTDNRFKTPEEKATDRLKLVYDSPAFSGMERDDILIGKLSKQFGTRLPMLNLHTLLATALWLRKIDEKWTEKKKDVEFKKFCGPISSGGMDVDPADVMRYEVLLKTVKTGA